MSEPTTDSVAEMRGHPADVTDRARRKNAPPGISENDEEAGLNRLADEAESEGTAGSVSLEEMSAQLQGRPGRSAHRVGPDRRRPL